MGRKDQERSIQTLHAVCVSSKLSQRLIVRSKYTEDKFDFPYIPVRTWLKFDLLFVLLSSLHMHIDEQTSMHARYSSLSLGRARKHTRSARHYLSNGQNRR